MKQNIFNVKGISTTDHSSGTTRWRKITVKTGSLVAPETFEINLFWDTTILPRPSDDETVVIQPIGIEAARDFAG